MRTEAITAQRRPRWLRVFLTALVVALLASLPLLGANPAAAEVVAPPASVPLLGANPAVAASPPHIMVIVEENEGYANVIGSSKAPYINSLVSTHASATKWYGLTDSSLADYVALISGTTGSYSSPTLVGELATAGISWKAYMEGAPSACYTGPAVGNYQKVHNPFVHFKSITSNTAQCDRIVPFAGSGGFASDLTGNVAPSFMFVVPNVCDDMHSTCSSNVNKIKQGDNWLQSNLATVLGSPWYMAGGIVIITWDSATTADKSGWNTGSGGHIPTIVISATFSGAFSSGGNLYGTLRAIEEAYGVGLLGKSSSLANGDLKPAL
jgi:phosphatidylinositol-3-phosphatase